MACADFCVNITPRAVTNCMYDTGGTKSERGLTNTDGPGREARHGRH